MKIAFVVTFFGELPFWFPAFQLSCKYNQDITWIIFSNNFKLEEHRENIIFIKLSLDEFCEIASKKIGVKINLSEKYLYKICDFKPAFGLIYEDYLHGYDFWGHCDLDIIWGKINDFITEDLTDKYDIITSREKRISGHFCLYRNVKKINRLFFLMPQTVKRLQTQDVCERLDEVHFTEYIHKLIMPNFFQRVAIKIKKMQSQPLNIFWNKVLTTSGESQRRLMKNNSSFKWQQGRVYDDTGTEMMYLHFHLLKKMPSFKICDFGCSSSFFISSYGISENDIKN